MGCIMYFLVLIPYSTIITIVLIFVSTNCVIYMYTGHFTLLILSSINHSSRQTKTSSLCYHFDIQAKQNYSMPCDFSFASHGKKKMSHSFNFATSCINGFNCEVSINQKAITGSIHKPYKLQKNL